MGREATAQLAPGALLGALDEEEAREQLLNRYLGGQPALLTRVEEEWDRFGEQVDRLWSIAQAMRVDASEDAPETSALDVGEWDRRVQDRARVIADDARMSTFDRLGDNAGAFAILEARLGQQPP